MKITIEQMMILSQKYNLRIVIEKDCISFIYDSRGVYFYDIVLEKLTFNDIESCIKKMIGGSTDEDNH